MLPLSAHTSRPTSRQTVTTRAVTGAALAVLASLLLLGCAPATAFYLPGAEAQGYEMGGAVSFRVNSLRSNSVMFPKDYYKKTPFCRPDTIEDKRDSIGETIWGDRQHNSLYQVRMGQNSSCMVLPNCDVAKNNKLLRANAKQLTRLIEQGYRGFMNIDNLPVFNNGKEPLDGKCRERLPKDQRNYYQRGYALGVPSVCTGETLINNHIHFTIQYNNMPPGLNAAEGEAPKYMVVGLQAAPYSIKHASAEACTPDADVLSMAAPFSTKDLAENSTATLYWTYSVEWTKVDIKWATRWDAYLHSSFADSNTSVHVVYMGAGILIVLVVASAVTSILMRTLRKDIVRYNSLDPEELQEETGWKLVHADVFRPPDHAGLLCILFANGVQILSVVSGLLLFSTLGMLSPSRRGSLLVAVIMLIVFTAFIEGYACAFLQLYFNCKSWRNVVLSGCALQGALCGTYFFTMLIAKAHDSTAAATFGVVVYILFFWLMVSLPLTVLGASFAFRRDPLKNPVQVGRLAREIPTPPAMNHPVMLFLIPPLFPLATIIMELHFVMQALWAGEVYYVFGCLTIASVLWVFVTALVTVTQLYYVLCYENHRWWWIAFMCPGCMGLHLFLYACCFFFTQLSVTSFASGLLYFLYMGIISVAYGLASGAVGLAAGITFTRFIYSSIKID